MPLVLSVLLLLALPIAATQRPERPYDALHYRLITRMDPAQDPREITATVEIRLKTLEPTEKVVFDTHELTVTAVRLQKNPLKFSLSQRGSKELVIELPKQAPKNSEVTLSIDYRAKIRDGHEGLFKVKDPDESERGPLLFTQLETNHARKVFPCNDHPSDKATTEVEVTVPKRYAVISNGRLLSDRPVPQADWHTVRWKTDRPHSTYLFALAVAPLTPIRTKHAGKEISVWVGKSKVEGARFLLESTRRSLDFLADYLATPYPWEKYAVVGIPTFLWGGMENTSATFQNQERSVLNDPNSAYEKRRITSLTAHEVAHQWFGDYVTPKTWADLWLNESFASFLDARTARHLFNNEQDEMGFVLSAWDEYFRMEDGPRSHPIVNRDVTQPNEAFDAITYTKGGNVLRMLSHYVGEERFRKGLKAYLSTYALGNATYQDFFASMEKATGEKLAEFRDSWLLQRGYPIVTSRGNWDDKTKNYTLKVAQRSNHEGDGTVFRFRLPVAFHRRLPPAYSKRLMVEMGEKNTPTGEVTTSLPAPPEWITLNPGGIVLTRIVLERSDEKSLITQATYDPDPISRLWALRELAAPWREGKLASETAEKAVAQALKTDPSPYVRIAFLETVGKLKLRRFSSQVGDILFTLAQQAMEEGYEKRQPFVSDPHGWRQWRSKLLFALGRVDRPEVTPWLAKTLGMRELSLDDLNEAAQAVAARGENESPAILKEALRLHADRGYRYRYWIWYAFGAYESPKAAVEIREISKTAGEDLMSGLGYAIRDNETLRMSPEWSSFLKEFVIGETRFSDEVKSRLLQTIEDVKADHVKKSVEAIAKETRSERLKEAALKILEKNFAVTRGVAGG